MSQLEHLVVEDIPEDDPLLLESNLFTFLLHLENLMVSKVKVKEMPSLHLLENLKYLSITDCPELEDFSFLISIPQIESLTIDVRRSDQIQSLNCLKNLKNLEIISQLRTIDPFIDLSILEKESFKKLEIFTIIGPNIKSFNSLKELKEIRILCFSQCCNLKDLSFLNDMEKIKKVKLFYCFNADLSTTNKRSIIDIS